MRHSRQVSALVCPVAKDMLQIRSCSWGRCERMPTRRKRWKLGRRLSSKCRRWVLRSANIHDRRCLLVLSVDESGVGEKKVYLSVMRSMLGSTVWSAALYIVILYLKVSFQVLLNLVFDLALCAQSNAYYRINTYIWFFQCVYLW